MEKQIQTFAMNNGNTWLEREDKEGSPTVFNLVVLHIDVTVEPVSQAFGSFILNVRAY